MSVDYHQFSKALSMALYEQAVAIQAMCEVSDKADGSVVTQADEFLQEMVRKTLQQQFPDTGFLGEEMSTAEQQAAIAAATNGLWCLDPLDGTSNFAVGIPFWCVSLALIRDNKVQYGLIVDLIRKESFHAIRGEGAWLNGKPLSRQDEDIDLSTCIANVDFKRLTPEFAQAIVRNPCYRSQRNFGSCALEWCWLAAGRIQVYLHGGMKLWDYAAGSLILDEAGGQSSTLEGETVLDLNAPKRSVVAAQCPSLFRKWQQYLKQAI